METLLVYKSDWDNAVRRVTDEDPDFRFDRVHPDHICENCVLAVAAERHFGKPAYALDDELDVDGVTWTGPKLLYFANRFDAHLIHGRLAPCVWPVELEIYPVVSGDIDG